MTSFRPTLSGRPPSPSPSLRSLPLLLALALLCLPGCPEDDDDDTTAPADDDSAGDDDSGDDDTTAGDDDSGDDDTTGDDDAENACAPGADWFGVLPMDDPQGDAGGYLIDIRDLSYQVVGGVLHLRMASYDAFDDADPGVMVDLFVGDGETTYSLTYDNQVPDPDPLQLWSSGNDWLEPLPPPPSLCHGSGGASSIVLGVKLSEIGFEDAETLRGRAGVNLWDPSGNYTDMAPDGGTFVPFSVVEEPLVARASVTVDDSAGGDGDGVIEAGETLDITIDIYNGGIAQTGSGVTGTLSLDPASTVAATVVQDSASYHNAAVIPPMTLAHPDVAYQVSIDGGAVEGEELRLQLHVDQGLGPGWDLAIPVRFVGLAMEDVLVDAQDAADPFDVATMAYGVTPGGRLVIELGAHAPHAGSEPVWVLIDGDLDGQPDHALATHDGDLPTGLVAQWDEVLGWDPIGVPDPFEYPVEGDYARFGVDLSTLGDPEFAFATVETLDPAGATLDLAPDDPFDLLGLPVLGFVAEPLIRLVSQTYTEVTGDGDAYLDPGEAWSLALEIRNDGRVDAAAVTGEVQSGSNDVQITAGTVDFGAVAVGASAAGNVPATFTVDPGAPVFGHVTLQVSIDADGVPFAPSIEVPLGVVAGETTADAPLIPFSSVIIGDTSLYADDYGDPSACTGYPAAGRDAVYAVDLAAGQAIAAVLEYTLGGPDAVLYLSDDAADPDGACLAGADDGLGESESLAYVATTAGTHYVVVDGYAWGFGHSYQLTLDF